MVVGVGRSCTGAYCPSAAVAEVAAGPQMGRLGGGHLDAMTKKMDAMQDLLKKTREVVKNLEKNDDEVKPKKSDVMANQSSQVRMRWPQLLRLLPCPPHEQLQPEKET